MVIKVVHESFDLLGILNGNAAAAVNPEWPPDPHSWVTISWFLLHAHIH